MQVSWGTVMEKAFIIGLGTFSKGSMIKSISDVERLRLLRLYRQSMSLRSQWGSIDPIEIEEFVDSEIAALVRSGVKENK